MLARVPAGDLIDRMRHEPKLRTAEVLHSDTTWRPCTILAWARHRDTWAVLIRWPDGHDDWREYDPRHIRPGGGAALTGHGGGIQTDRGDRSPGTPGTARWRVELPLAYRWAASQSAARLRDARDSHASWITSVSSARLSSPTRLARSSTDKCPLKCGVVKNGDSSSWTIACLSASDSTQNTITSGYRSPVPGSTASGRGVRKKMNDFPPTW
jgi:hypothetical protein